MTSQQISVKLQSMNGKSYKYANNIHVVNSYKISKEEEHFTLITDQQRYKRTFAQADEFFKHWFDTAENRQVDAISEHLKASNGEVVDPPAADNENLPATSAPAAGSVSLINQDKTDTLADDLVKILKDNITKVSSNPGYIKQAQAVDKSVSTILNVKRLQLDMHKALNSKK